MNRPVQLPLSFALPEALGPDDFLPAPCNAAAVDWIGRWPDWPVGAAGVRGVLVHGPEACGKSHLAAIWARRAGAVWLADGPSAAQAVGTPEAGRAALVVDDADRIAADSTGGAALFQLYGRVGEAGGFLLATSRRPPGRWPGALPDLTSRLATLTTVAVGLPDDGMIEGLLIKLFADRQLRPTRPVIAYLVARIDRTFAAARTAVSTLDAAALERRRPITLPLAREVLGGLKEDFAAGSGVDSGEVVDDPGPPGP